MDKVVPVFIKKKGSCSYIREEAAKSKHTKASPTVARNDHSDSPKLQAADKAATTPAKKPSKYRSKKLRKKAKNSKKANLYESSRKPRASRPSETVSIGMGVEPQYKKERIKASEVTLDEVTAPIEKGSDKSILYAAGWSAEGAFTDSAE